ncbi:ribonucleoside-diphosphate reductase subunit alpha [Umezawaea endophytica]|uniref:Ribonucleoside-diphosphate reductase n=1 Tax=Umezawaea endophytica TaxID=1654476 RepID=A0A9X2VRG9_9PSEU|nr:ribonucleoside-diphosphate reductase subunit alpha [Umezawaea endophytica]MCS7481385.1 ribonucleoside-diphosphate reductase subunit alpha [Umezawaea endophytica]
MSLSETPVQVPVIGRGGTVSPFDPTRIATAVAKAFHAVEGAEKAGSQRVRELVAEITGQVEEKLRRQAGPDRGVHIEQIQDQVELVLMRDGHHKVARAYVLYREEHAKARSVEPAAVVKPSLTVRYPDGRVEPLDDDRLALVITEACAGLPATSADAVLAETRRNLYDGISRAELALAPVLSARTMVEVDPDYSLVSARLLLDKLRREALTFLAGKDDEANHAEMSVRYPDYFADFVRRGVELGQLDPLLEEFDLERLGAALLPDRDLAFQFLGMQVLYDRYFLHSDENRYELPQAFFMRVAMGLALREDDREARAVEFYELLSSFDFMCSTPTLFNAGTTRPQLSSCFLTTVDDDLQGIFHGISNNALLSKFAGGLGNDWTPVRGIGAHIKGTNGKSQGVVPFLKIANDTAVAVNQGGKRKGAVCAYLETWHIDVEEFLDLRKNTGDERRRTHDMNTANWVPDEFMRRVRSGGDWSLFSPDEVPDLHDLFGDAFSARYREYEAAADRGEVKVFRRLKAADMWRRMLTMLFETGHPWITFKDPCNLRSPQQHSGVVHSSNLCTEITLNTSLDEVAVCNLGSVNLAQHTGPAGIDSARLEKTVRTAVRMLDNVIDVNYYTIPEARRANLRHRPVGLGLMGFQDALFAQRIPMGSDAAVEFADRSMEEISYYAISASADLAAERGAYESYEGSLWSQGILPFDSIELLAATRGDDLELDRSSTLDWTPVRDRVRAVGMRNSNVMAIAPTATIANICGVNQSIEPLYRNLYVKSNMSGDFTVMNPDLIRDLKARGLWDEVMVGDLKYFDGSLSPIERIPAELKALYATAFELDSRWLVEAGARRQKWIDQAQSLNLYIAQPSGRKLDELYQLAWLRGVKTTYYLRSQSATHVEKSTLRGTDGKLNAVSPVSAPVATAPVIVESDGAAVCSIIDPDCEACQ